MADRGGVFKEAQTETGKRSGDSEVNNGEKSAVSLLLRLCQGIRPSGRVRAGHGMW